GAMLGRGWSPRGGEAAIDGNAPVIRMAFDSAMGIQYAGLVDISNDGSTLAYTGPDGVRIVELDGPIQRTLPGTEEAEFVVFSHDGSELAVFDNRSLYRVPVAGGPPIPLLERPVSLPVEWAPDGTLYFLGLDALYRLPPEGEPERIADVGLLEASTVTELPGGRWLLYSRRGSEVSDPGELRILDLETLESRTLLPGGFSPRYAATGHVVYARNDQSVLAVEFDAEAGEVVGRPFAVLDSLAVASPGLAPMALSETGSFFYVRGPRIGERWHQARFARVSEDGAFDVLPIPEAELGAPHLSPDGEHLAFTRGREIVVHDLRTGGETKLPARLVGDLSWSADGERIAYQGLGGEGGGSFFGIWRWREGATAREVDVDRAGFFSELDFTPDGRLIGHLDGASSQPDILVADTAGAITPYLNATWSERHPRISPDGEWVAYDSDESGAYEVYLRAYPTPGERYDISAGPGRLPLWTPEGDLYFTRGDSLWLAEVSLDPEPTVRSRRPVLSREQPAGRINLVSVTAGPGGEIIALFFPRDDEEADADEEPEQPRVAWIVANWFSELLEHADGN
ncbi:MAG TPA: hypothetical protein VLL48_13895, partial [Longimicrobiales bacterium]|nr:hypothetical protein [Longimicrobiales bacterium]